MSISLQTHINMHVYKCVFELQCLCELRLWFLVSATLGCVCVRRACSKTLWATKEWNRTRNKGTHPAWFLSVLHFISHMYTQTYSCMCNCREDVPVWLCHWLCSALKILHHIQVTHTDRIEELHCFVHL